MLGDGVYYLASLFLLVANLAGWAGNFYQLPGNWLILANSLLVRSLLPPTTSGLGLGWFSISLLLSLALLGETLAMAAQRHRLFSPSASPPIRQRVMVGAGIGSVTCVLAGLSFPVIGSLLAVIGACAGAAGGAWLGSVISLPSEVAASPAVDECRSESQQPPVQPLPPESPGQERDYCIPKVIIGGLMVFIATYASLF